MSKSPTEIEDEIAQTRERIDIRMSMLNHELSLGAIISRIASLTVADGEYTANRAIKAVRENPVPVLLVVGGLALMAGSRATAGSKSSGRMSDEAATRVGQAYEDLKRSANRFVREVKGASVDLASGIGDKAAMAASSVGDASSSLVDQVSEYGQQAYDAASDVPDAVRKAGTRSAKWVRQNPIPAALVCVAAGAAIGTFATAMKDPEVSEKHRIPRRSSPSTASTRSRSKVRSASRAKAKKPNASRGKATGQKSAASEKSTTVRPVRRTGRRADKTSTAATNGSASRTMNS